MQVPEGLALSLFASEPLITNPAAIDVDTHGRVWVAEIQWYRAAAKQPPADKIKVLEDTDGDGRADRVVVFAEGLFCPMSICVAGSKVYVATSPDLWVYEDKDGDLRADGPPTKLLTGFKGKNHDHGAHSLVLGPDHKWWMSHGDAGFDVTGTDGSKVEYKWGARAARRARRHALGNGRQEFSQPLRIVRQLVRRIVSERQRQRRQPERADLLAARRGQLRLVRPSARPRPAETPFGQHWHFRGHVPGYVPANLVTGFGSPCGICFYEGDCAGAAIQELRRYTPMPARAKCGTIIMKNRAPACGPTAK